MNQDLMVELPQQLL